MTADAVHPVAIDEMGAAVASLLVSRRRPDGSTLLPASSSVIDEHWGHVLSLLAATG